MSTSEIPSQVAGILVPAQDNCVADKLHAAPRHMRASSLLMSAPSMPHVVQTAPPDPFRKTPHLTTQVIEATKKCARDTRSAAIPSPPRACRLLGPQQRIFTDLAGQGDGTAEYGNVAMQRTVHTKANNNEGRAFLKYPCPPKRRYSGM